MYTQYSSTDHDDDDDDKENDEFKIFRASGRQ